MAQLTMYPGKAGSPKALTTADITDTDTQLYISDLSVLPAAPNILALYTSPTIWEVCKYTVKQSASGAGYVTIVRSGAEWASSTGLAQSWASGTKVARNFFLYDYSALKNNVEDHETRLGTVEGSISTIESSISTIEDTDIPALDGRVTALENNSGMDPIVAALIFG